MGDHFCIDGPSGALAVWTGGTDLGPVTNPGAHPTRVRFNSLQENIGFHPTPHTGTYTNNGWAEADNTRKITLFAHGLNYRPFLLGFLRVSGTDLPINGSTFHVLATLPPHFFSYTIGADSTNVYLNIFRTFHHDRAPQNPTVSYTIYRSNYGVNANGSLRRPPYFNGIDINDAGTPYIRAGYFDTAFRYPYQVNNGAIAIPNGATISYGVGLKGSGNAPMGVGYRYSVLGHVVQHTATSAAAFGYPAATGNNASFNASVTRIAL